MYQQTSREWIKISRVKQIRYSYEAGYVVNGQHRCCSSKDDDQEEDGEETYEPGNTVYEKGMTFRFVTNEDKN